MDSALGAFSISINFSFSTSKVGWFTGVYGPSSCFDRANFWQELLVYPLYATVLGV